MSSSKKIRYEKVGIGEHDANDDDNDEEGVDMSPSAMKAFDIETSSGRTEDNEKIRNRLIISFVWMAAISFCVWYTINAQRDNRENETPTKSTTVVIGFRTFGEAMFDKKIFDTCGVHHSPFECHQQLDGSTTAPASDTQQHPFFERRSEIESLSDCSDDLLAKLRDGDNPETTMPDPETSSFRDILKCATLVCSDDETSCVAFFHRLGHHLGHQPSELNLRTVDIAAFDWNPWHVPIVHGHAGLRVKGGLTGEVADDLLVVNSVIEELIGGEIPSMHILFFIAHGVGHGVAMKFMDLLSDIKELGSEEEKDAAITKLGKWAATILEALTMPPLSAEMAVQYKNADPSFWSELVVTGFGMEAVEKELPPDSEDFQTLCFGGSTEGGVMGEVLKFASNRIVISMNEGERVKQSKRERSLLLVAHFVASLLLTNVTAHCRVVQRRQRFLRGLCLR